MRVSRITCLETGVPKPLERTFEVNEDAVSVVPNTGDVVSLKIRGDDVERFLVTAREFEQIELASFELILSLRRVP